MTEQELSLYRGRGGGGEGRGGEGGKVSYTQLSPEGCTSHRQFTMQHRECVMEMVYKEE